MQLAGNKSRLLTARPRQCTSTGSHTTQCILMGERTKADWLCLLAEPCHRHKSAHSGGLDRPRSSDWQEGMLVRVSEETA